MSHQPTNAELKEMISQMQGQLKQLTALVCAHNGVAAIDEMQINQVARDFSKRGPEAITDWNRQRKARRSRPTTGPRKQTDRQA